ncbi:MAG: serine hydrolase domain-containing protein [Myxococcota bacterium]
MSALLVSCGGGGDSGSVTERDAGQTTPDASVSDVSDTMDTMAADQDADTTTIEEDTGPDRSIAPRPPGTFAERNADVIACLNTALDQTIATGAVVGFMEDGQTVWQGAFGTKGIDIDEPVEVTTLFRFGSVLKMMTSAAALSLVDEGLLSLDTDIRDTIPGLDFDGIGADDQLNLHRLLSHQGGMVDELEFQGPSTDDGLRTYLLSRDFLDIPFHVPPATFYNYSNPNFYLAGLLIEEADGSFFNTAMRNRVFAPLGMTRTMFQADDVLTDGDYARGTSTNFLGTTQAVEPGDYENTWARPAGLGWTSLDDLLTFGLFLMDGDTTVLSSNTWEQWRSPQVSTLGFGELESYGYGVIRLRAITTGNPNSLLEVDAAYHDGSTNDFTTLLYTFPETGFVMATMVNGPSGPVVGCALDALVREAQRYPEIPVPDSLIPDPTTFVDYVGYYSQTIEDGALGDLFITQANDGRLQVTVPAWDDAGFVYDNILAASTRDNFTLITSNGSLPITGVRDPDTGELLYLRTRIAVSQKVTASKKSSPLPTVDAARVRQAWEQIPTLTDPLSRLKRLQR